MTTPLGYIEYDPEHPFAGDLGYIKYDLSYIEYDPERPDAGYAELEAELMKTVVDPRWLGKRTFFIPAFSQTAAFYLSIFHGPFYEMAWIVGSTFKGSCKITRHYVSTRSPS